MVKKINKTTLTKRKPRVSTQTAPDLREQFAEEAAAALRMLLELMANSDADAVRLKAAQDILDRAGFKPVDRRELAGVTGVVNTSIDYSDPAAVTARIKELRQRLDKGKNKVSEVSAEQDCEATRGSSSTKERPDGGDRERGAGFGGDYAGGNG